MALERTRSESAGSRALAQVQGIHGAHDVQLVNSSINVAGRDQHTHIHTHVHYHEIKDKLKAIFDAISNYRKIQQDTLARATPGTVLWLLECDEFKLFVDVDGTLKILWGSGMPGAGKTILASIVINKLEALARDSNGEICVAYAYIRYSDQDQVTIRGILESLVKQTIERHPDCVPLAQQAYETHVQEGTRPTEEELHQLISQFVRMKRATFYILDALDEAPEKIRLKLLQKLSSLGVRLFITSRPLPGLQDKFPGTHTFSIRAQDKDLDLHIKEKISLSERLQDLLEQGDPAFTQDNLISTIKEKCGGMFLHASLQLDALEDCLDIYDAMQILEEFPQEIEDVYLQTWNRILKSDKHQASLAKAAFAWVLSAQRSLTVDLLRHALAMRPETYHFEPTKLVSEAILPTACRGLIIIDKESKLVRLVHYTAKEPLEALLVSTIPHPHSLLAAVCTTRLADCGFQNSSIEGSWELDSALEADPLLAYAYEAWVLHTRKSLDVDLTFGLVSAFITGCQAFPVKLGDFDIDHLPPLHIAAFFNLPLKYAGPYSNGTANTLSITKRMPPLHLACRQGHGDVTQSLLCLRDTQINLADGGGRTALMIASEYGHEGLVKLLLARPDTQVNLANTDGSTALMIASSNGRDGVVKLLLTHPEIQVNLANADGSTALMLASANGHEHIVKLLLARPEIQVNLARSDGSTALMFASEHGHEGILTSMRGREDIVMLLLAHPEVQVNLARSDGSTALTLASMHGHEGVVKLLLAHPEIQVNLANNEGWSALMLASRNGHTGTVELLFTHPLTAASLADHRGSTALLLASQYGHTGTVALLLDVLDINVNSIDDNGDTALKMAAEQGEEGVVRILLNAPGINTSVASTRDGHTAMSAAVANGHHGVVRLLAPFKTRRGLVSLMGTQSAKQLVLQSMLSAKAPTVEDEVEIYEFRLDNALVVSVANLPAFEDDDIEHNLSVCKTLFNFFQPREPGTCNGVIMAYDLSRHRLRHCDLLNLRLVKDLCGIQFLGDRLAILTTNWLSEPPAELTQLEGRESDLRNLKEDCFLHGGARYHRHNLPESPSMVDLIAALAAQPDLPLTIQEEISNRLRFNETTIGGALAERLRENQEIMRKQLHSLAVDLENLKTECWDTDERDAMQKDLEALEAMLARLDKVAEEGFT